jgi:hypothetical protein
MNTKTVTDKNTKRNRYKRENEQGKQEKIERRCARREKGEESPMQEE